MTTASTSTVLDQSSDAAFRTWVAEIITQLVTNCGITQTSDTGQINTGTVTRAAINTSAGYVILRYNDSLQSTVPVFIKLEFGSAGATTVPQMWITIGAGSNGSGTLTGTTTTRVACLNTLAITSTTTSYTSRYVYNSTYGYMALVFKIGSTGTATVAMGAIVLFRSNDTSGAATGDSVNLITNSSTATGGSTNTAVGVMQCLSAANSAVYPPTIANGIFWSGSTGVNNLMPFGLTSTTTGGNSYTVPVLYLTPIPSVSAYNSTALIAEAAAGSTFSEAIVGATALTFLSCGQIFGAAGLSGIATTPNTYNILWQ